MTSDKLMVFFTLYSTQIKGVWIVWWSACSKLVSIFATKHSTAVVVVVVAVVVVTVLNVPSLSTFHLASVPIMSSAQPGTMQSRAQLAAIHHPAVTIQIQILQFTWPWRLAREEAGGIINGSRSRHLIIEM